MIRSGRSDELLFITLEGIEGSGKTTLAEKLSRHFKSLRCEVVSIAEPGGSGLGIRIRELLLSSLEPISDNAELLLFEASRAQLVDTIIKPALERGAIVICDRFADSSLAYQGYARGIDVNQVRQLNCFATSGLTPDITILLDLSADAGLARQSKIDRISSEDMAFHERVREGFLAVARSEPDRFVIIDAMQDEDSVLEQALKALEAWPRKKGA